MNPRFRCWHEDLKKMLYPTYKFQSHFRAHPHTKIGKNYINALMTWDGKLYVNGSLQNVIWMLDTGIVDIEGKSVWEGDIINQGDNFVSVVQFGQAEGYLGFYIQEMGTLKGDLEPRTHQFPPPYLPLYMMVLGNIYESKDYFINKKIGE